MKSAAVGYAAVVVAAAAVWLHPHAAVAAALSAVVLVAAQLLGMVSGGHRSGRGGKKLM
jgi:hypothetical protein